MTIERKPSKPKKCRVATCRASFVPSRMGQAVCSPACAMIDAPRHEPKARKALADIERKDIKVRKERLKSRGDHMRGAQQAFNAYIRARDQAAGHPCISSGKPLNWGGNAVDAGHYRSVGSAPHLRFDERNCHAQSKQDNRFLSGNAVDYRIGLIARIGQEAVDALEADQAPRKYSLEQIEGIKAYYRAKTRELKKGEAA